MTEQDIQYALGQHLFLKNICVPNVLMSGVKKAPYEADFIYFNLNTLHLTEPFLRFALLIKPPTLYTGLSK